MTFQVGDIVRVMSRGKTFEIVSIAPEGIGFDHDGYMFPRERS